jgi:arginine N-succinyltransferase
MSPTSDDQGGAGPGPRVRDATGADLAALSALRGHRLDLPTPASPAAPASERMLLAETPAGELLGTLRLRAAIGLQLPRWWYHVGCAVHAAADLKHFHRQATLMLGNDLTGASELAEIAAVDGAPGSVLHHLVQAALQIVDSAPQAYGPTVIAELPGLRDADGVAPFWQGLGRHFYAADPAAAARQHGREWPSLVAALLPRQPIYASFLPDAAQAAIGKVHPQARRLQWVLEDAGFSYHQQVCIDDAGRVLERRR